jgi:hypothetical protein
MRLHRAPKTRPNATNKLIVVAMKVLAADLPPNQGPLPANATERSVREFSLPPETGAT